MYLPIVCVVSRDLSDRKNDNPWHLNMVSSFSNKNSIYPVTTTFHDYTETYESVIRVNIAESLQNVYKWKLLH